MSLAVLSYWAHICCLGGEPAEEAGTYAFSDLCFMESDRVVGWSAWRM